MQRKEQLVAGADRPLVYPNDTPTLTCEERRGPFADAPPLPLVMPAAVARTIRQDGAAVGLPLDDAVAAELADAMLDALCDDEEAALDLASLVFDADVRRALAS
jgi:hypothetical protein